MLNYNLDYLNFDAYSIKRVVKQKLSENPHFTDYLFDDSNFVTLLDTYANLFQMLMFYLNSSAAESMFSDTHFYENITRITKLIDYRPKGYSSPQVLLHVGSSSGESFTLPPFMHFTVDKKRATRNKEIVYTTANSVYFSENETNVSFPVIAGTWKLYNKALFAQGIPYEEFVLNNLYSDHTKEKIFAFPHMKIYVKRHYSKIPGMPVENKYKYYEFLPTVDTLFFNEEEQRVQTSVSQIFELTLNEHKQVKIRFGNGIYGEKLIAGDELVIVYIEAIGRDSNIGPRAIEIDDTIVKRNLKIDRLYSQDFQQILQDVGYTNLTLDEYETKHLYNITNNLASSLPSNEEDVDEIRENAPRHFKTGNRLVTREDFDYFIRSSSGWRKSIADVYVMNNAEYISTFYRWLYNLELRLVREFNEEKKSFITDELRAKYDYYWSDACDFNNVYIFVQYYGGPVKNKFKETIINAMNGKKCLTAEPVLMTPLLKNFVPCAFPIFGLQNEKFLDIPYNFYNWDERFENYFEITVDSATTLSPEIIRIKVINSINDYFSVSNQKIGGIINLSELHGFILAIDGVKEVRTVFKAFDPFNTKDIKEFVVPGLQFAAWTNDIVDGADLDLISKTHKLENFQFAQLQDDMENRVKIITDSTYQFNII